MKPFWIDADAFIQTHNGLFGIDIALPFWKFIDEQSKVGVVKSSMRVYEEVIKKDSSGDPLAKWVKNRKNSGLFVNPATDKTVQDKVREINDWVYSYYVGKFKNHLKVQKFLSGADVWIIAHACCSSGVVVSHESRADKNSQQPKIPNVSTRFGVECVNMPEMLRRLKFSFK
jgi:hypothetical protein